jgi:DNA invertase Pin-like site-specific DNA recombinase
MEVVDPDVGQSAASPSPRAGFNTLGGQITWGQVGLILAAEATRLARHGSDGDPRLARCGDKGGLMAEGDGLDDPSTANGRLLLGWQGPRSEWALHTIRARLSAGLLNKAARGDRVLTVPTGREREAPGHVRTAAHLAVHARLRLVFTTFLPRRSASQVRAFFKAHGLRLPRRERLGAVGWTRPTVAAIRALLQHPAYAGAFP